MANFIFCAYSVIFFIIFAREILKKWLKIALWTLAFACLFFGILWRHNAIFSAFPAFFIICYLFLENRKLAVKSFIKGYVALLGLSVLLCLVIVIGVPKALTKGESNPQNHLLLLQIAGACVPADDASCFKDEWYINNKTFDDVKKIYKDNPLFADLYTCWAGENAFFPCSKLNGLTSAWIKAIVKHPINFLAHELPFFKGLWLQIPYDSILEYGTHSYIISPQNIHREPVEWWKETLKNFPKNEWKTTFTPLQEKIYTAMYKYLPILPHIVFVAVGFFGLLLSAMIWAFRFFGLQTRSKELLIFAFSTGLTAFASAFIIAGMAMNTWSRYMFPVVIFGVMAFVGFVAFALESLCANRLLVKK